MQKARISFISALSLASTAFFFSASSNAASLEEIQENGYIRVTTP